MEDSIHTKLAGNDDTEHRGIWYKSTGRSADVVVCPAHDLEACKRNFGGCHGAEL